MFENLKDTEKLLLQNTEIITPTFEMGLIRFLLGTISELRARNHAVQEVKDECNGEVLLDEINHKESTDFELDKLKSVLIGHCDRWINSKPKFQLFNYSYNEKRFVITIK
jgi:hypothetical protein